VFRFIFASLYVSFQECSHDQPLTFQTAQHDIGGREEKLEECLIKKEKKRKKSGPFFGS